MSKIREWDTEVEFLQAIDFRLRVTLKIPLDEEPDDYVKELKEAAEELGGVSEVAVHSWEALRSSKFIGQRIEARLRVRSIQPKEFSAGQIVIPLIEGLQEVDNVLSVDEHSWTRLKKVDVPCND